MAVERKGGGRWIRAWKSVRKSARKIDNDFPTIVRYMGIVLVVYAALIDKGRNPALIPAATGLILFRTVYRNGDRQ